MIATIGKAGEMTPYPGSLNDLKERVDASPNIDFWRAVKVFYAYSCRHYL